MSGITVPLVTITDFSRSNQKKRTLLMIGRIYPGETHSSWVIHGFIRFLVSKNSIARQLRSRFVFKILPMVNIDGVIAGNYRATFSGLDVSKCYDGKTSLNRMMPEALLLKKIAHS
jgi:murein tripeptide amidase MpaA